MRLKFFKRSADKFQSRIDPHSEAYRDLRANFPAPSERYFGSGNPQPITTGTHNTF